MSVHVDRQRYCHGKGVHEKQRDDQVKLKGQVVNTVWAAPVLDLILTNAESHHRNNNT